ncbi:TIGR03943 family protein [Actinomadura sp. DC4]|uniref:TIGR03943 family putative permease subunit n=1 Tax=Actinomadura sp. DC4 TaxID=3055069 RepID=UPI0025B0D5A2|nr:TIGR03943 family protein [Actinomadura sp. DC4]MDN3355905.1 TIGR03943 family protein [Actinomadura sp. DC4]
MSEDARATTVLLVGALMIRLAVGGAYAKYVRTGMGPLLLVAGVLLAGLGLFGVMRALRHRGRAADEDAHGHHHDERIGWLLLAPVLALLLVTPPTLGSFGVARSEGVSITSGGKVFDALAPGRTVPMTLLEFDERAADHHGASFGAVPVRLTGFVTPSSDRQGFRIARYQIACCAADAVASVVRITGASGSRPARDQWVTVTGTFNRAADGVPELHAVSLAEISTPVDPYE